MATIADQSTMTLWPSWVWTLLFITAAAVLVMVVTRSMHERSHARRTPSPAHPAHGVYGCAATNCNSIPVQKYRGRNYCRDCADEIAWLDHLAAQARHAEDVRMWERELSGGDVA